MSEPSLPSQFLSIDETGFVFNKDEKITHAELGFEVLESLHILPNNSFGSRFHDEPVIIEAFDSPLIVQTIEKTDNQKTSIKDEIAESFKSIQKNLASSASGKYLKLNFLYDYTQTIEVQNFFLDPWDRLHGELESGVPFTFSRKAQEQFFDMLEEYSDDEFVWNGKTETFHPFWGDNSVLNKSQWWNKIYEEEENPRWNLAAPSETLKDMLPRLKLPKSKILVLGCGDSHDAAYFAEHGHLVTAVDISPHAIARSKKLFSHLTNITWIESDLFSLPTSLYNQFDIVYEYTCFCAINPEKRQDLIKVWNQCLHDQGQLMGTFFCMHKRIGPPFGGTEWEMRERLKKNFQFLFWGRWQKSLPRRQGRELFVLAKKIDRKA